MYKCPTTSDRYTYGVEHGPDHGEKKDGGVRTQVDVLVTGEAHARQADRRAKQHRPHTVQAQLGITTTWIDTLT